MLVLGATGRAGALVLRSALAEGAAWAIYMVETPSRGALEAQPTNDNIQHGSVSYCDVADALVKLAGDETRAWERKALFFNYASAK
jgi:hypothetical protein